MIDSQPNASPLTNARKPARRQRQKAVLRQERAQSARWKVQLELEPSEIALVYRQGLAHGAEVRRHSKQEWRPLVTTPELRAALSARDSQPDLEFSSAEVPALNLTQTLTIREPALAALLSASRSKPLPTFSAPPPPPVISTSQGGEVKALPPVQLREPAPDLAVTQPRALPLPFPSPLPLPSSAPSSDREPPQVSFSAPVVAHARPKELSLVAMLSVALTLIAMFLAQRASRWGEARVAMPENRRSSLLSRLPAPSRSLPEGSRAASVSGVGIPVVPIHSLPLEQGAARLSLGDERRSVTARAGVDRAELARVVARAAASAKGCGSGPVIAQVVATFGPSGTARAVHFGSPSAPAALRSCILRTSSRARVSPFVGEPVTVSKSLRW